MRIGIISDAHGNAFGTEMCLKFFKEKQVEKIFFLGDAVGYLPDCNRVVDMLINNNVTMLLGNHDGMLTGELILDKVRDEIYKIENAGKNIRKDNFEKLKTLLPSLEIEIDGRKIMFMHASPWNYLEGYVYSDADVSAFNNLDQDVFFMGHTHLPFIKDINSKKIVNVGSCGLPRDVGNLASCCIYETLTNECMIFRLEMDLRLIIESYGNHIHKNVIDVLNRKGHVFFGEKIKNNLL